MLTRRTFLQAAAVAGAGFLLPGPVRSALAAPMPLDPSMLEKYVDDLPLPDVLRPLARRHGVARYRVPMRELYAKLHRDLPETRLWGYGGTFPGPSFDVRAGVPIDVEWVNELPAEQFLPVDMTLPGAPMEGESSARAVVHLHGGHVAASADGHPKEFIVPGESVVYRYGNRQRPATLWYHDHALSVTRLNVYAGLAGFYLLRGGRETSLRLPRGRYELPIVIQDRSLNDDGSLYYPSGMGDGMASVVEMFFGDIAVVNGKAWPHADVEPAVYRLRLLNGSNSRTYALRFKGSASGAQGPSFTQIGSDGGLLPAAVTLPLLSLAPGERADVLVDFRAAAGTSLRLTNEQLPPAGMGMPGMEPPELPDIMAFNVEAAPAGRAVVLPKALSSVRKLKQDKRTKVRDITLDVVTDDFNRPKLLLGGKDFKEAATETPLLGSTEVWRLINLTMDMHPMHLHLVQYQVLDRTPFDAERYMADMSSGGTPMPIEDYFTGPSRGPEPGESGWKDTVQANPGEVTRIITRFTGYAGDYVWHCHILEHEDYDMVRPLVVRRPGNRHMS